MDITRASIKLAIPVKQRCKRLQVREASLADRNSVHIFLKKTYPPMAYSTTVSLATESASHLVPWRGK